MTTQPSRLKQRETKANASPADELDKRLNLIIERSMTKIVARAREKVFGGSKDDLNGQSKLDA